MGSELVGSGEGALRGAIRAEDLGGGGLAVAAHHLGSGVDLCCGRAGRRGKVDPTQVDVVEDAWNVGLLGQWFAEIDRRDGEASGDANGTIDLN